MHYAQVRLDIFLCVRDCAEVLLQLVGVDSLYIHKIGHFHMAIAAIICCAVT